MYPVLQSMGVTSYNDIEKFSLRFENGQDVLKIHYHREKGSFLPKSKKFKFGRSSKTLLTDGGRQNYENVEEPSATLLSAMEELESIVGKQIKAKASKDDLLIELSHLEKVVHNKIDEIKKKIEAMD